MLQSLFQYRQVRATVRDDLAQIKSKSTSLDRSSSTDERASSPDSASAEKHEGPSGIDPALVPGVTISRPSEKDGAVSYVVGWREADPQNPQNWSFTAKWGVTIAVCLLTFAITIPSSINAPTAAEFDAHFHVNAMAGSMATGMYLIGLGVGALFAGTISETFGRNVIYLTTFVAFMLFVMASGLAPNYGAAIVFRFLAGFFGSTPMTAGGGSVADIWTPLDMIYVLPVGAMTSYAGPIVGPIVGAYLDKIGFRWADWLSLILAGATLACIVLFQPETYAPTLLEWRAAYLRELTGDCRYVIGAHADTSTIGKRLLTNIYRPFVMAASEPIIQIFTFYLLIVYFVLFTFLNGYPYIFADTYGISVSLTFILWTALLVGDLLMLPCIPLVYGWAKKAAAAGTLTPEICVWYGMLGGSFALPISIWWLAWTCYRSINIWVPIVGSLFFGYGLVCVFTMTFLYTCFVYGVHSASALAFMTSVRYIIAGAIMPASVPMYQNLGPHKALTIPACLATVMAPVPFLLYKYGDKIRAMSKNAMH